MKNMEERLRGLVHLLDAGDEDDLAFLDLANSRFQNRIRAGLSLDGLLTKYVGQIEYPIKMLRLIEEVEDLVSLEIDNNSSPSVLLEIQLPSRIDSKIFDYIFQLIDGIQRVCLHFNLPDRTVKLFYVTTIERRFL